ncbi:MAG: ribulose-phosphate 3-epimerase [Ruminococcaceae bacterium]|nr:ribulose-phosphate 3-epimerase [Oscillospiraceae bacterium]
MKNMDKKLSASIMCADLLNMEESIKEIEKAGIDYLHIDIMDGAFVPNITLGFDLINSIKKITDMPLDVHMMVNEPSKFIDSMCLSENDIVCVHSESEIHIARTLEKIKSKGIKAGLAINPATPVENFRYTAELLDMALVMTVNPGFAGQKIVPFAERKVKDTRILLDSFRYYHIPIEVDGNISIENGMKLSRQGADIFVLGTSALFMKDKNMNEAARDFRAVL